MVFVLTGLRWEIPREDGEVGVFVDEDALVSALVEVPYPLVASVVVAGVGDIKMAHEFAEIAEGCFNEQVEVVGHEDVAGELDSVDVEGAGEALEEAPPVGVVLEDVFLFIAPARDVVDCSRVLNAERSGHARL